MSRGAGFVAALALLAGAPPAAAMQDVSGGAAVRSRVQDILARWQEMGLRAAGNVLLDELELCGARDDASGCRALVNHSLAFVYHSEAAARGDASDSLFLRAAGFYDDAIVENPGNWAAWHDKALLYREMGAREWQEPFFREAAERDPERRATYLSLQGDYYAERGMQDAAARAYEEALLADPAEESARVGLVEAYRAMGPRGLEPLFEAAERWRFTDGPVAAGAYAVVLEGAIGAGDRALADTACIRLVDLQERVDGPFLTTRPDLPSVRTWGPALQVDSFMVSPDPDAVPWWRAGDERRDALAGAARLRGRVAAADGDAAAAERFFLAALELAEPEGAEAVDLQRELALLYTRDPELDPGGARFRALEERMFAGKTAALQSGDLVAAQRFHTTLGLIYAERETWTSDDPHRNAAAQLTWALQAATDRERETGFHQPLPGLRALLARGLAALERTAEAAPLALESARAWLDVDDGAAALTNLGVARRLGADDERLDRLEALARARSLLAPGDSGEEPSFARVTAACEDPAAPAEGTGPPAFERRQRFKLLSDCARAGPVADRRARALAALAAADTAGFTLIGAADVRRFRLALETVLRAGGRTGYSARDRTRIEAAPPADRPAFAVSVRNSAEPRWLSVREEDLEAARGARTEAGFSRPPPSSRPPRLSSPRAPGPPAASGGRARGSPRS